MNGHDPSAIMQQFLHDEHARLGHLHNFNPMECTPESHPHLYQLACEHARARQQSAQYTAYLEQQARMNAQRQEVALTAQMALRQNEIASHFANSHAALNHSPFRQNQANLFGYTGSGPPPTIKASPVRVHLQGQKRLQTDENPYESAYEFRENFQPAKRNRCMPTQYDATANPACGLAFNPAGLFPAGSVEAPAHATMQHMGMEY